METGIRRFVRSAGVRVWEQSNIRSICREGRYRVESPGSNSRRYDLLIDSVELHDAGTYYCIDGSKQQAKAVLTVLGELLRFRKIQWNV